jgi:hypothetical protein
MLFVKDDPYLRRAQEMVDAARKKRAEYRGGCAECVHSKSGFLDRICTHPAVELTAFNVTDAYAKDRIVECGEQRDERSVYGPVVCGPNGALFEPREGTLVGGLLTRFFGKSGGGADRDTD